MSLKVLHILDHSAPLHSGYAFRTLAILREQRRLGLETHHLTSTKHYGATGDEEDADGFHFYRTTVPQAGWRRLPVLGQAAVIQDTQRRLEQVIEIARPDLLHAHSPCLIGIAAMRAGKARRLPVVYEMRASWEDAAVDHGSTTEGSTRYRLSRALETWVLKRAAAVTTICEGLRQDIVGRGVAAEHVTVIPNGVDIDRFPMIGAADAALRSQLGLDGCFVIGFIGSFYGYEGLELLITALPRILEFEPNAKVILVGGGPEESNLRELAARLEIADRIVMLGRVPHGEVARYYSLVDVLAFPRKSIRLTETVTPLKPLEAMAQGRLLIASNVGGHRELIEDGRTGYLFPPDDPAELTTAIRRVLGTRDSWAAMRERARTFVETERTWRASVARYPAVYDRALRAVPA